MSLSSSSEKKRSVELLSELERKYFWWDPVVSRPRSDARVVAQAMNLASFQEMRQLETVLGFDQLAEIMRRAEPGWISDRSWEFWRGRLGFWTGRAISEEPPRRSFNAQAF
jgi:hypothetical protein